MNISDDLQVRWWKVEEKMMERFGKKPDVESILFLIGIQELGDIRKKFTKEQKTRQLLMDLFSCTKVLIKTHGFVSREGYGLLRNFPAVLGSYPALA